MPYTSIADASFQDVVNLWFSTKGQADVFDISTNNPFYGQIEYWDTHLVTDMSNAFNPRGSFNSDISRWNTSNVNNMEGMFYYATSFDQSLNTNIVTSHPYLATPYTAWDVSGVQNMSNMFSVAEKFNQPLNNWNVSNVRNMLNMFGNAIKFNQPLNDWNVSNVTNMLSMFIDATSFNQPLFHWDVSNVTNFVYMFDGATSFDQYIRSWDVNRSLPSNTQSQGTYKMFGVQGLKSWCPLATDTSKWNTENNPDNIFISGIGFVPGTSPTASGYFNQDLSGSYAPYYSYNYSQYPNQIIIETQPGSPTGAGLYTLNSVTPSEIPTSVTIDETNGTLTISTADILGCKSNNQIYTINITENTSPASTSIIIVTIKNTPRKPYDFPFPLEQKNKSLYGVNQKLDPGTARPNYFITRSQFNPARFRSKQSNLSNPSLCFF
jgi:surface protein